MLPGIYMKLSLMTPITGDAELLCLSSLALISGEFEGKFVSPPVFLPGQRSVDESTWSRVGAQARKKCYIFKGHVCP
jgi:hypothetical protein